MSAFATLVRAGPRQRCFGARVGVRAAPGRAVAVFDGPARFSLSVGIHTVGKASATPPGVLSPIEKGDFMILIERRTVSHASASEQLVLPYDARCKSRLRARLKSGEECSLFLERGAQLRAGDKLLGNDGRVVEVIAADEALMEVAGEDARALLRAAWHLGCRQVALEVTASRLRFLLDHAVADMVRSLGLPVAEVLAPFAPEYPACVPPGAQLPLSTSDDALLAEIAPAAGQEAPVRPAVGLVAPAARRALIRDVAPAAGLPSARR